MMDNDIDYGEAFGMEVGEKETEAAEPSPGAEGALTDHAGPAGEKAGQAAAAPEADGQTPPAGLEGAGEKDKQSRDDNARFAAARRKAEAEIAKVRREAEEATDKAIASIGLKDPYTGKPITTKAELEAYNKARNDERKEQIAENSGLTVAEIDEFIQRQPEVVQARETVAHARQAQQDALVKEQLAQIQTLDPTIKSLDDLARTDTYEALYGYVKRGNTLYDAYRLANYDRLTQQAAAGARQQAINGAAGKGHLTATGSRGEGAAQVPGEIMDLYRELNPNATEAEIRAHWQKSGKR